MATPKKKVSKKIIDALKAKPCWADYAAKDFIPKYVVNRFDDRQGNRFYYFLSEGKVIIASGVTSAFGTVSTEREAINKWKEKYPNWRHLLNISSEYGTALHMIFKGLTLNEGVNKTLLESMKKIANDNGQSADMPVKDTLALMKFQEDYQLIPLLVEAQLTYYDEASGEWLCMTIDILAKMVTTEVTKVLVQDGVYQRGDKKGEPKMVEQKIETKKERILLGDLKSNFFEKEDKSFYETHVMQLIAGKKAVEQNFDIKVDGLFNLSPSAWRTKPICTFFEHKVDDDDMKVWDAYWKLIIAKKINAPKGNILISGGFKDSNDYQMMSYQEYAEQILLPKPI